MSKDEAVLLAFEELGLEATPADVKVWAKEKHKLDVGNDLITRTRQSVRAKLGGGQPAPAMKPVPPPVPVPAQSVAAPPPLDVAAIAEALETARRLVAACGGKEAAKRLIEAA
jgi:hypothetical protein